MDAVTDECPEIFMELTSMLAYRRFLLASWEQPSAAATLVAFHNIVTNSIDVKWHVNGRHRLHCLANAIADLPPKFLEDLGESPPTAKQLLDRLPAGTPTSEVMGLGADVLSLQCPLPL